MGPIARLQLSKRKVPMVTFKKVQTNDEKIATYKLRFDVYCIERCYLNPNDYPDQLEYDQWDEHSAHFVAIDGTQVIGTTRLILDSPIGFPLENHFNLKITRSPRKTYAEVSRLIAKPTQLRANIQVANGLYRAMLDHSLDAGITDWLMILDNRLLAMYRRIGFVFDQLGSSRLCFGCMNGAYTLSLSKTLANLKLNNPKLYSFLMNIPTKVLQV